jgi:hypothetical protein
MSTPAALARARAEQATQDRIAAEEALLDVLATRTSVPDGVFTMPTMLDIMRARSVEALLEHGDAEVSRLHSAARRAQRLEARARSAAMRAQLEPAPAPAPAPSPTSRRYLRSMAERLADLRMELAAA